MLTLLSNLQQIWKNLILGVRVNSFTSLHYEMLVIDNVAVQYMYIGMFTRYTSEIILGSL